MTEKTHIHPSDVHGLGHLAIDATLGLTDLVETMHDAIVDTPPFLAILTPAPAQGITGLVYASIRGVTRLVGGGIGAMLAQIVPLLGEPHSSPERDAMLAALNGILGDYLAASGNSLTIPMRLRRDGQLLELAAHSLATTLPQPSGKILLLVHGLCMNDLHWRRKGHDHGALLATNLGYTPVYLHYNTGLHISTNGRALAGMIEALLHNWPVPVEELVIIGHSMGGLVSRSACYYGAVAGHAWLRYLRKIVFLGTPHHGAPLERHGNGLHGILGLNPYTAAFARLGKIRSAGITDLRYGYLLDEDWQDRDRFAHTSDRRRAVPLPGGVQCYTIGATIGKAAGDLHSQLLGDGLVPLSSALGSHIDPGLAVPFPQSRHWIGYGMNHLDLLHRPEVYERIQYWLVSL